MSTPAPFIEAFPVSILATHWGVSKRLIVKWIRAADFDLPRIERTAPKRKGAEHMYRETLVPRWIAVAIFERHVRPRLQYRDLNAVEYDVVLSLLLTVKARRPRKVHLIGTTTEILELLYRWNTRDLNADHRRRIACAALKAIYGEHCVKLLGFRNSLVVHAAGEPHDWYVW